jgi:hypothetical protein
MSGNNRDEGVAVGNLDKETRELWRLVGQAGRTGRQARAPHVWVKPTPSKPS